MPPAVNGYEEATPAHVVGRRPGHGHTRELEARRLQDASTKAIFSAPLKPEIPKTGE